ncbi:MAG: hypothetical protein ACHQ50_01065 [Fimbriimonadales bacterium]
MGRIQDYDSVRVIESALSSYLNGDEVRSILTPGEFSEWPLTLKAGQVVIAEARSDAFDPALEVADDKGKVLGSNDDRYPGDQRPLLFWRCEKDGDYSLQARCFHDKSGGQFFIRFKVYDSVSLSGDGMVEKRVETSTTLLLKIPMKAGQIKQVVYDSRGQYGFVSPRGTISSCGLPDINLSKPLDPAINNTVMAPVDGDYYVVAGADGGREKMIRVGTRDVLPATLQKSGSSHIAKAPTNSGTLWTLPVKAGEVLETSTPELPLGAQLSIAEVPDISKYSLEKPETNPFFPDPKDKPRENKGPAFVGLPGRARDSRITVFAVKRDATLWLASNGSTYNGNQKEFTLTVKPAPKEFAVSSGIGSQLRIGNTDYWEFDAKAGDVMTFDSKTTGFAQQLVVRDPYLNTTWNAVAAPDQPSIGWNMIIERSGKYLLAASCLGDGGGGDYTLSRKVYPAREFGKGTPARGDFSDGQVRVWKFTAKPGEPLYLHWKRAGSYRSEVRNESGAYASLPVTWVDGSNGYGIINVREPTTYLIALFPDDRAASYSIELSDLPGYGKGK